MCRAISSSHVQYSGPAYNALRNELLDNVKDRVNVATKVWTDHAAQITGYVMVSDGWSDAQNRALINILLVSPKVNKFLQAVDTSGHEKNGAYIADVLSQSIEDVGIEYVMAVIMDGASNNVSANRILEEKYVSLTA